MCFSAYEFMCVMPCIDVLFVSYNKFLISIKIRRLGKGADYITSSFLQTIFAKNGKCAHLCTICDYVSLHMT